MKAMDSLARVAMTNIIEKLSRNLVLDVINAEIKGSLEPKDAESAMIMESTNARWRGKKNKSKESKEGSIKNLESSRNTRNIASCVEVVTTQIGMLGPHADSATGRRQSIDRFFVPADAGH